MSKTAKGAAGAKARPTEWQMPEIATQMTDARRRVEPILDASGTLRRHVLSKLDEAHAEVPARSTRTEKTSEN